MTTGTYTQTRTHARYVAAKIAADLKRLQRLAGQGVPSDSAISNFEKEATQLLYDGYLGTVTYGFLRGGEWIAALQYSATSSGDISDQDPGGIGINEDVTGAVFSSFLTYSDKWWELSNEERRRYEESKLPFVRSIGGEPAGRWSDFDNSYKSGDIAVDRRRLMP